ncbi:MAG: 3-dehydroquinate synthase [Cyclobacteriaceae bacterium]|nr:3-dehydroquinate synthase [Cyclobacteriaceae bacterium]
MKAPPIQSAPRLPKSLFRGYSGVAVVADENTFRHCYGKIKEQLPPHQLIVIPAGEQFKNLDTCRTIWQQMTDAGLDRHSVLVGIGGGVIGDMAGFCASTFKRGMACILVPTTLLAMADASIGGKTGIDFGRLKNHIGTFALPASTWIATGFLDTLPRAELRSGFAEVIKHALISDKQLWNEIRNKPLEKQNFRKLVRHSVEFKSAIVRKDPRESGLRKVLNFGHTVGHALEGLTLGTAQPLLHGEAIAAGMIVEGHIAYQKKLLREAELEEITACLLGLFGKVEMPSAERLLPGIGQDKKNKGKMVLLALPKGIGKAVYDIPVSEAQIRAALGYYRERQT